MKPKAVLSAAKTGFDALKLSKAVKKASKDGPEAVQAALADTIAKIPQSAEACGALIWVLEGGALPPDDTADIFQHILDAHSDDKRVLIALGDAIEAARDLDDLNAPPSETRLFADLATKLSELQLKASDTSEERDIVDALGCTTRLMARQKDSICDRAHARRVEIEPDNARAHYCQGLFFKTRGRFAEGVAANQRALELGFNESAQWNLGICATGAGEGQIALEVWRGIKQKIDMGRFDLPEGRYPPVKVRLAERPLALRNAAQDDPGLEETIWIERLSPCHGIIRSVLYEDLGVDYGDVVLFDGAPITTHMYGDQRIPVFPHLATLRRGDFRFYDFSATQPEPNAVSNASEKLTDDAVIYSHTESTVMLCKTCFRDETRQHDRHEPEEHLIVHGRIAAPPSLAPDDLLSQIDTALADIPGARLFAPDLCLAAGDQTRATLEQKRFDNLRG